MRISCLCIILCEEDNSGVDAREEPVTKVSRRLLLHPVGDDDVGDDDVGDDDDDDDDDDENARDQGLAASAPPPCW